MRMIPASGDGWLSAALEHLGRGGVVAVPTETVYGFAGALREEAVEKIYALKGRAAEKALPLQCDALERAVAWGFAIPPPARRLAERFWPGPLTLLLQRPANCPDWFARESSLLALRIPDHPVVTALLAAWGAPLAVTSANPSGQPECLNADSVCRVFGDEVDLVVLDGGASPEGEASTVVDASGQMPRIMREGPITREEIVAAWRGHG